MNESIIKFCLGIVGLINFFPVIGVISTAQLTDLYGIVILSSEFNILLRHRAVLLGIIGGLLIASIWIESLRQGAISAGFISMISYIAVVLLIGDGNSHLVRVAWVDAAALIPLAGACLLMKKGEFVEA